MCREPKLPQMPRCLTLLYLFWKCEPKCNSRSRSLLLRHVASTIFYRKEISADLPSKQSKSMLHCNSTCVVSPPVRGNLRCSHHHLHTIPSSSCFKTLYILVQLRWIELIDLCTSTQTASFHRRNSSLKTKMSLVFLFRLWTHQYVILWQFVQVFMKDTIYQIHRNSRSSNQYNWHHNANRDHNEYGKQF